MKLVVKALIKVDYPPGLDLYEEASDTDLTDIIVNDILTLQQGSVLLEDVILAASEMNIQYEIEE